MTDGGIKRGEDFFDLGPCCRRAPVSICILSISPGRQREGDERERERDGKKRKRLAKGLEEFMKRGLERKRREREGERCREEWSGFTARCGVVGAARWRSG